MSNCARPDPLTGFTSVIGMENWPPLPVKLVILLLVNVAASITSSNATRTLLTASRRLPPGALATTEGPAGAGTSKFVIQVPQLSKLALVAYSLAAQNELLTGSTVRPL